MKTRHIRHQDWLEYDTYIEMILLEPFWSGYLNYKGFNKESREWGIGVATEAINEARKLGKKLRLKIVDYGTYEISPNKCLDYIENGKKTADKKIVLVIPHSAFLHIPTEGANDKKDKNDMIHLKVNQERMII